MRFLITSQIMVRYSILGSGSSGNSYIFSDGSDALLVDNGFSRAELMRRIESQGFDYSTIRAVFVTHLHPDHARGVGTIARKDGLCVFTSGRCQECEYEKLGIPQDQCRIIEFGDAVSIGSFLIRSFPTSHDSTGSSGYYISCPQASFTIVTDTGVFDQEMVHLARQSDVLFLESNYDSQMLKTGPYPYPLKKRIDGPRGHLSNTQAEEFLNQCGFFAALTGENKSEICYNSSKYRISKVFLVHLSDTNNSVSLLEKRFQWMGSVITVCPKGAILSGSIGDQ